MRLDIYQVDAFTKNVFGGNPAAVCPLDDWLPDQVMQGIAVENNLSETAFFVKEVDRYAIRWFSPTVEVNICGHATIASAHVIFNELGHPTDRIDFHSHRSGALGAEKDGDRIILDFPAYAAMTVRESDALIEQALGRVPLEVYETVNNGLMLRLESEQEVRDLNPDLEAVAALKYDRVYVTARGETCDFASRMFAPKIGIPEDPVTGGMHCTLIPYWAEQLGKTVMFARQVSRRGGELYCEFAGQRVKIGGNAITYLTGEIDVEVEEEKSAAA
jgi:PhzF family phenazine biosynthesis protein